MSKKSYHQHLSEILENALLHLFMQVSATKRFVPMSRRNEILVKFLKLKMKQPKYKNIKNEIKRMILVAKDKNGDLEAKLHELHDMAIMHQKGINDAQKLYDLLTFLFDEHQFDSKLFDKNEKSKPDTIYILQDHLVNCFDEGGQQVAPVSMLIESERTPSLVEIINTTGLFQVEMKELDSVTWQAHIFLHPRQET